MAAGAERVKPPADRAREIGATPPVFAASSVRGLLVALERMGHDPAALRQAVGLTASDLGDPDELIPCATLGALLGVAQQRRPLRDFSLRLAQETPLGAYPLLDYLIVTAGTVGEGMRRMAEHARLIAVPMRVEVREDETPIRVIFEIPGGDPEYSAALSVLHLRREADGPLRPEYVSLARAPDDAAAYEAAMGCPLRVGATWTGFALSPEAWRLPMRRRDPALQGVLERHAAEVIAKIPAGDDVASQLRRVLARRVAGGDTRVSAVAREMGASARTLQRRLAAAGLSYRELLDRARCDAAEGHLSDASLSIAEVSWLLGFSEPSAFHRAFKRWRGVSPQVFRRRARAGTRA